MSFKIEYDKPEGCRAAITENWSRHGGGFLSTPTVTLEAQVICGDRNNTVTATYNEQGFSSYNYKAAAKRLEEQATNVLGAMCLGCEHKQGIQDAGTPVDLA